MVCTEQQLQVKKLVDVQQDIEIDALNDGVGALSTSMQNGFTEASNNFNDIQNSLAVMNGLSESRYNTLYDSVNILSNDMSNIASGLGDAISNVASDMINMNNGIQNQFNDLNNTLNTAFEGVQNTFYYMENDYHDRFNQVNTNIGDSINNFHNEISNDLYVNVFSADTMIYNVSATPVNSLTALGYDSNGKIIPVTVIANTNIQFPPSANYLYTDVAGTAFGGTADTEVNTNNNLITSYAVYNAVNDIWTDLNEFHNEVTNSFGSVQNSFNAVDSTLAGVQNQFNDVNNAHNELYQNVVDGFIDVWGNFDKVNNSITNMNSNIQGQFNSVNNDIGGMSSQFSDFYNDIADFFAMKSNPVNYFDSYDNGYENVRSINFIFNAGLEHPSIAFNNTTNILDIKALTPTVYFNEDMTATFAGCVYLNQNIRIPFGVYKMVGTFQNCTNLNQNIKIPDSVLRMVKTFQFCTNLNQNIKIPNSAFDLIGAFHNCVSLNQNISIPSSAVKVNGMTVVSTIVSPGIFTGCSNLNQDIYVYSDKIDNWNIAFLGCTKLASRNIHIPKTVPLSTSNAYYNGLVNNTAH